MKREIPQRPEAQQTLPDDISSIFLPGDKSPEMTPGVILPNPALARTQFQSSEASTSASLIAPGGVVSRERQKTIPSNEIGPSRARIYG